MNPTLDQTCALIWRNLPLWPSTFGPCSRCKTGSARGAGLCLDCATSDLGAIVGQEKASEYVLACQNVRRLEHEMQEAEKDDE